MKERNQTIDIAKGIAIILMVIGHCYSEENVILRAIYAFHMPFFFIVSGMLYAGKWKSHVDFRVGLTCRRMLIPYFVFDTAFCIFVAVLSRNDNPIGQIIRSFSQTILTLCGTTVTWYLPCQLMTLCIVVLVLKHGKSQLHIPVFAGLFLLALLVTPADFLLPIWRSFIGTGFFAVGYYGKSFFERKPNGCILVLTGGLFLLLSEMNGMVSLVGLRFANPLLYVATGLTGSFLLLQFCMKIPKSKWAESVAYLGKNSIVILCTHMFVVECVRLLDYKLFDNALYALGILEGIVFGGMAVALQFPIIWICNRYLPKLFGK